MISLLVSSPGENSPLRRCFPARRSNFAQCRAGSSAVVFAMFAPILIILLVSMISYGLYLGAAYSVQRLAVDGVRASIAGLTETDRNRLAEQQVARSAQCHPLLDGKGLSVKTRTSETDPDEFIVSISYDAKALPIWIFDQLIPLPSKNIVRTASIKRGSY